MEQATRPQTIGYALLDSPVALAAWMIDHDTDSYQKIARASAARSYWEEGQEAVRAAGQAPTPVSIPVGFTTFPGEIWRTPRTWVEKAYPNVI